MPGSWWFPIILVAVLSVLGSKIFPQYSLSSDGPRLPKKPEQMHLHEYQAKNLFLEYGIPVAPGRPAHSVEETLRCARELGGEQWIVKAQVHAGGRGKAGGIRAVRGLKELEQAARELLGKRLVTRQSGPAGQPVHCVLVQEIQEITRELYLAVLVDRGSRRIRVIASPCGGMNIEEIAAEQPEHIHQVGVHPGTGLLNYHAAALAFQLSLDKQQRVQWCAILRALYRLFLEKDLGLAEINPLIVDEQGRLLALDAKVSVDDNALFRQAALAEQGDPSQEDECERAARAFDLNYVALEGNIGCMVNGAGLAMATMDIIKLHGGEPANFLDVGGNATVERVTEAFKLISAAPLVRALLVNIFGGIVRCDLIAEGIIQAVREVGVRTPLVVRLKGTRVTQGRELLAQSGLNITLAEDLDEAARKAVAAAGAAD